MNLFLVVLNVFVFLFGLCIGSFLNCVIYRLEQNKSFLKGRSFCPHCKHVLNWQDLFPVFSFLFLKGKCRHCKKKISWQYPVVELFTGILFVLVYFKLQETGSLLRDPVSSAFWLYAVSSLIIIFIFDLKHYIIPDKVLFPAIIIAFLFQILSAKFLIFNFLLASLIASGFFFIIFLVSGGRWMGFGDVKLAILMGLLLGVSNVLVALFLAFFFGAIIGLILMFFGKKKLKSEIPFGPFLIAGTFVALFWGSQIINWYMDCFKI